MILNRLDSSFGSIYIDLLAIPIRLFVCKVTKVTTNLELLLTGKYINLIFNSFSCFLDINLGFLTQFFLGKCTGYVPILKMKGSTSNDYFLFPHMILPCSNKVTLYFISHSRFLRSQNHIWK